MAEPNRELTLELLRAQPMLAKAPDSTLTKLLGIGRLVSVDTDAYLFREGTVADRLYLLVRGHVVLETHAPGRPVMSLESLTGGDICGLSWLFAPYRFHLDARAVEPTQVIALDGKTLREWMEVDAEVDRALLQPLVAALYQRLERVRLLRLDVYRGGAS